MSLVSLKFTAYSAYMSLQETSNLMVKHITRSHFLGVFERTVTKTPYGKTVIQIPYGNAS